MKNVTYQLFLHAIHKIGIDYKVFLKKKNIVGSIFPELDLFKFQIILYLI